MIRFDLLALAATKVDPEKNGIIKIEAVDVIVNVLNMVYFLAGATAVIVIVLSGFSFASSSYDPAKIAIAKNSILYSVVGLIVIITAFAITQFIAGRF